MGRLGGKTPVFLFGRKKPAASSEGPYAQVSVATKLQELCRGDDELYRTLSSLMFLDPKKITMPIENVLSEAREMEAKGNNIRAEVGYRIAGGISLYRGDIEGVKTYFSKAASFSANSHPEYKIITKRADQAVSVARKFYENSDSMKG